MCTHVFDSVVRHRGGWVWCGFDRRWSRRLFRGWMCEALEFDLCGVAALLPQAHEKWIPCCSLGTWHAWELFSVSSSAAPLRRVTASIITTPGHLPSLERVSFHFSIGNCESSPEVANTSSRGCPGSFANTSSSVESRPCELGKKVHI